MGYSYKKKHKISKTGRFLNFKIYFYISLFIFIVIASFLFVTNPDFQLSSIEFHDYRFLSLEQLNSATAHFKGKNTIITAFSGKLSKQLQKSFPQIQEVSITINFSDLLSVSLKEKKPYIAFLTNGKAIIISKDGTILGSGNNNSSFEDLDKIIIIRGFPHNLFNKERVPDSILEKVNIIIKSINRFFKEKTFQLEFTTLEVNKEFDKQNTLKKGAVINKRKVVDELLLLIDDTLPVIIGEQEHLDLKLSSLKYFLSENIIAEHKIKYIDLRAPGKLVIKKR